MWIYSLMSKFIIKNLCYNKVLLFKLKLLTQMSANVLFLKVPSLISLSMFVMKQHAS